MSLNWKEINLILDELQLPGMQIQKAVQSAFDVLALRLHGRGAGKVLLIALTPGACRLHETRRDMPKSDKPLRFAEFLNSRIVNGWIEEAVQLGEDRIVRLTVRQGERRHRLYIRLWSNAANVVVTGEDGGVLDAMRRLPKRGELSGGVYRPEESLGAPGGAGDAPRREFRVRELPGDCSFNEKIDAFYAEQGGALSLEALREEARRIFEGRMDRLGASLEKLRAKEADFASAERLRRYGDLIMANMAAIGPGDEWLEAENFFESSTDAGDAGDAGAAGTARDGSPGEAPDRLAGTGGPARIRIRLDPQKGPAANAAGYYGQYRKAKSGLDEVRAEIAQGEAELTGLEKHLARLLEETNPLALYRVLRGGTPALSGPGGKAAAARRDDDRKRPGLSFRRGDWLIMVGRDAAENDALLRRHVKGNDLWLHVRDFPGSYVFIKQRAGKSFPLDILLDAGNLALFYSRGRNNGEADLFYTPVKYLRRAREGPRGLVIPTQEKNLHIRADERRLKELEICRVEK